MLSQLSVLAHQVGERVYNFLCSPESPLPEIKEALFQFNKYVANLEDQAKQQAAAADAAAKAEAEAKAKESEPSKVEEIPAPVVDEVKPE